MSNICRLPSYPIFSLPFPTLSVSPEAHPQGLPFRAGTWLFGFWVAQPGTTLAGEEGLEPWSPSSTPVGSQSLVAMAQAGVGSENLSL